MKWQSPGLGKSGLCFMFYNILEKEGASIFDTPSYDQARHSVASVMAVCYWASGVPPWLLVWGGLVRYRDAILASGMGTWGRSRVRHDAEAWVPVAGWTWCGMGRKTARRFL